MRKFFPLAWIGLLLALAPQVRAYVPGDVGSAACLKAQVVAQAVGASVSTAVEVVVADVVAGEITGACAACIINQFALGIPIEAQGACGVGCGDRVVDPALGEQCDPPGSFCSGGCDRKGTLCADFTCRADCTCPAPVCGDGICQKPGEDKSSCPKDCAE